MADKFPRDEGPFEVDTSRAHWLRSIEPKFGNHRQASIYR